MTDQVVRAVIQVVRESNEELERRFEGRLDRVERDARRAAERAVSAALHEDVNGPLIKSWKQGKTYKSGDQVSYRGGTWQAMYETDANPLESGDHNGWALRTNGIYSHERKFDGERTIKDATEYSDGTREEYSIKLPIPVHRGTWDATAKYENGDEVNKDGHLWRSLSDNNNDEPGTSGRWTLAAQRGKTGKPGMPGADGKDADPTEAAKMVMLALAGDEKAIEHLGEGLVGEVKNLFNYAEPSSARVGLFFRGEFRNGDSYQPGDVVTIMGLGVFICVEETTADPRTNAPGWRTMFVMSTGGGVYLGGGSGVTPPPASSLFTWLHDNGDLIELNDPLSWTFNLGAPIGYPALIYGDGTPVLGSWTSVGSKITFTPSVPYSIAQVLIVDWAAVLDVNGDPLIGVDPIWTYQIEGFLMAQASVPAGTTIPPIEPEFVFKYTKQPAAGAASNPTVKYSTGAAVAGVWSIVGNTSHRFVPSGALNPSETITFEFDNVRSVDGETLLGPQAPISYTVEQFKFISFITTNGDQTPTALEQVTLTFNGPPLASSLQLPIAAGNVTVTGAWTVSGNTATFTPAIAWENYTAPFDFGLFNIQGQNAPPPPPPVANLTFIDVITGQSDGVLNDPNEYVMLRFNGAVDMASVPVGFTSYARAGGTLPAGVTYFSVQDPMSDPHIGFVINPPAGGWPLTDDGFFNIDISAFTSLGNAVTNPQVISVPTTFIAPVFSFTNSAAPNGDGTVDGGDALWLTFSEPPDVLDHGLPVLNQAGVQVPGFWAFPAGSNTVEFVVSGDWADHGTSFSIDLAGLKSMTGSLISNPFVFSLPLKRTLTQVSVSPVAGSVLTGSTPLNVTFNTPPGASNMPGVLENGVGMPGSWSNVAGTNTVRFTPSRAWTMAATVVVSWVGLVDSNGTAVSNPGTQSYQVLDQFLFVDSDPANGGTVFINGQMQLRFNKPVDLSTLLWPRHNGVPVPGAWSYVGGDPTRAIFFSNPDMGANWPLLVDYSNAKTTTGTPISNPGFRTFGVAQQMRFNFALPPANLSLTGSSSILLDFDMPPNPSTFENPITTVNAFGLVQLQFGTWTASGNQAIFTPSTPWGTRLAILIPIGPNVKSVWGTPVSNQTTIQYTSN